MSLPSSSSSFVLHVLFRPMSTDSPRPPLGDHLHPTPPLTIILTLILVILLFVGFFSIFFCRCVVESFLRSRDLRRSPSDNHPGLHHSDNPLAAPPGLDPLLINSFPTFPYSGIKEFRSDKLGLECAICLVEFDDHSFLRLLTLCYHVFHQDCIDLWLQSHKTCPVCRRNLEYSDKPPTNPHQFSHHHHQDSIQDDAISIDIGNVVEDEDEDEGNNRGSQTETKKFSRSHSTGHSSSSIVKVGREELEEDDDDDRHKLRLPENVKMKLVRGHNWTGSCVTFEEFFTNIASNGDGISKLSHPNNLQNPLHPSST